jgi:hypothetical protein
VTKRPVFPSRTPPVMRNVRKMGKQYRTRREAAAIVGVSEATMRALSDEMPDVPGRYMTMGELKVGLYDDADLVKVREYLKIRTGTTPTPGKPPKMGAPKKWSKAQLKERARLRQTIQYHRTKAKEFARKDPSKAERHTDRVNEAIDTLATMPTLAEKRAQRRSK